MDLQTYLLRTPALVTRRGFGEGKEVIGNGLANACTEAVSSSRIVGNDRSSLFSPNAGIDDDFLPPYFTSGFTLMTSKLHEDSLSFACLPSVSLG
ncbi:hypothetical protein EV421DRAFT_1918138 [Armillaria borealis]|uniref:Uncharacterized protein n=1 Tax=Armillaria borealis TaxID=47425 RepID=A0AA39ID78_9AGAR|nr:hypothetical protein EV421DRAFT_1918138 [Armillaria borealis]